jgi:hypothetical protein
MAFVQGEPFGPVRSQLSPMFVGFGTLGFSDLGSYLGRIGVLVPRADFYADPEPFGPELGSNEPGESRAA